MRALRQPLGRSGEHHLAADNRFPYWVYSGQQDSGTVGIASAAGYALHAPAGALPAHAVGYIYLPAAIGVAIASVLAAPYGTRLAHRIGGKALKQVFAAFMVMMGIAILASG